MGFISLPLNIEESFSGANNLKEIKSYQDFDDYQNPIECTDKEGSKVFYFWSNEGKVIAEIRNTTREHLLNALNGSWPSPQGEPEYEKLANLRNVAILENTFITTYKYKPLVGMTEMTDPRGVTTYYTYDSFGRLQETYIIENGIKKIIQVNDYHYQNQ